MRAIPLILNSRSGSANAGGVERLAGLYRAAGAEVSPRVAERGADIPALACEAAHEHPPLVVAAGGDGTPNPLAGAPGRRRSRARRRSCPPASPPPHAPPPRGPRRRAAAGGGGGGGPGGGGGGGGK